MESTRYMIRGFLCLIWSLTALAQPPQQNPIDTAVQAHWKARADARFEEAAAQREQARSLLAQMPVDAPQFGSWVQSVTQLYQGGGMYARAREVAQDALARTSRLGDTNPTRILLLNMMAGFWQEDRNLLKAVPYLEKAVAALEAAPPGGSGAPEAVGYINTGTIRVLVTTGRLSRIGPVYNLSSEYQRLAEVYQQLGRPDAAAAVTAKIGALASNNDNTLASFYERQGKLDEAAAIYQKQVTQAAGNPLQMTGALQSLANLYQREQRYGDAAATLQQAIATLDASGNPGARSQSMGMRQNLANMLRQAGKTEEADQIYQQLLAQNSQDPNYVQVLVNYTNYLTSTKRSGQAEALLGDYVASNPQLEPWQESNLLYARAGAARESGDTKRADEYQQAATEKGRNVQGQTPEQVLVTNILQKASSAANNGNPDEAFSLTLQAMDATPRAADRDQIAWQVPNIASILAAKKAPEKGEQLYQQLFEVVQSWSLDNLQPLLTVAQTYTRFLMGQKDRAAEVPEAIERYRKILMSARGAGTGYLADALRLTIEFERSHGGSAKRALLAAQDLLAMEESLSGSTSEPYLQAIGTLADLYGAGGDFERALPLRQQTVAIGDLVYSANDRRRAQTRINVAFALARQRQFDEAERLASEAVVIAQSMRPSQAEQFTRQLGEIRKMRTAAESKPTGQSKWFVMGASGQAGAKQIDK
jgi:tetratricopeptide (TPR) repeat protein